MPFIDMIPPDPAQGDVKRIYDQLMQARNGRLPAVLQVMSLHPGAMEAVIDLNNQISFGGSTLGRRREEMIATVVSAINDCDY